MKRKIGARRARIRTRAAGVAALCAGAASHAGAQGFGMMASGRLADWSNAAVGSEEEMYLRVLQVAAIARDGQWSLRPFGPGGLAALLPDTARHPWSERTHFADPKARRAFELLRPGVQAVYNTGFPFSMNDGFVWAGRGATVAARGGVAARWRWFSARVEPQVAWAANRPTGIAPNGLAGPQRFGDALEPMYVDAPQRFGDRAIRSATLGQSTVRVDALGLTAGASTANQWFGPAVIDPLVLGTNAAGFPHLFVGTSRPARLGIGTAHIRFEAGRLRQSRYSTVPADSAHRLVTAVSAVITIRGVPGLELGGSRLFHGSWPARGEFGGRLRSILQPFYIAGGDRAGSAPQNQLATLFGRWVFAGAEVWGEYLRNDASADSRDFWQEPDHNSGYTVGARRVWKRGRNLSALRAEALNTHVTQLLLLRAQTRPYQHGIIRQGHTEEGQLLGSAGGQGGLAATLGWDLYTPRGRWTVEGARRVVQSSLEFGAPTDRWDVMHYVRVERLRFGKSGDLVAGATALYELNRNFGHDAFGLRLDAGWRF